MVGLMKRGRSRRLQVWSPLSCTRQVRKNSSNYKSLYLFWSQSIPSRLSSFQIVDLKLMHVLCTPIILEIRDTHLAMTAPVIPLKPFLDRLLFLKVPCLDCLNSKVAKPPSSMLILSPSELAEDLWMSSATDCIVRLWVDDREVCPRQEFDK